MRIPNTAESMSARPESVEGCGNFFEYSFRYGGKTQNDGLSTADTENRTAAEFSIDELIRLNVPESEREMCATKDFFFYGSGWQSWGFGGEIEPGKYLKKYIPLIPQWKQYITFPGKAPASVFGKKSSSKKLLRGQFIIYLRWENTYLVLASTGTCTELENGSVPPVQFYVDRDSRRIAVSVYSDGKRWTGGELISQICVFSASSYFGLRNGIRNLFGDSSSARFDYLNFLSSDTNEIKSAGWESWYNHYADIDEKSIMRDLDELGKGDNIISVEYSRKERPVVFQVDDGWEKSLGDWDANLDRFPSGMEKLSDAISKKGYIPGLWLAPFIVDLRSDIAKKHPDWILRGENGSPIPAGMNPLWGKFKISNPCSFYCLDLSRDDVLEHLDDLMEKIINRWGFRYIKLDFMFAGMIHGRFSNGGAAFIWYERAIKKLTKRWVNVRGDRVAYLGCGVPLEASYKTFPLSRIGPDTKEAWDVKSMSRIRFPARTGAKPNLQSTLGHAFWDQGVFINDPDVIFMRFNNITLDDEEKELIALVNKLFASQIMYSDSPSDAGSAEADFTSHILSLYSVFEGEEFGLVNCSSETYLIFSRSGKYCGMINLSEKPFTKYMDEILAQTFAATGRKPESDNLILKPVVDRCVVAGDLYTARKHTISIFEIQSEEGE